MNAMNDAFAARRAFIRRDVRFGSGETYCSGWLHLPEGVAHPPVVVLGHGLGATREMRLDAALSPSALPRRASRPWHSPIATSATAAASLGN